MEPLRTKFKSEFKVELNTTAEDEMETSEILEEGELSDDVDELAPLAEPELTLDDTAEPGNTAGKRFDLVGDKSLKVPEEDLIKLYASLGIDKENERHYRFNAIHLRGTRRMKTRNIFEYFSGLEPSNVVWLGDGACNVEWDDEILSARALLYLSVEILNVRKDKVKRKDIDDNDDDDEYFEVSGDSVEAQSLSFALPPGNWRKGINYRLSSRIIMRYANKDDKPILLTSESRHKHKHHAKHSRRGSHVSENSSEPSKDPWGALAQTWGRGEGVERLYPPSSPSNNVLDLRRSLNGVKETRFLDYYLQRASEQRRRLPLVYNNASESDESESTDEERRRKLPRMRADREEERQKFARIDFATRHKVEDLRTRLNKRKQAKQGLRFHEQVTLQSDDSLDVEWASESYQDIRRTLVNRDRTLGDDSLDGDSELDFGDEPAEMLRIEIDNEYCKQPRRSKR